MNEKQPLSRPGLAVDSHGGAVVDPTENVKDLNEAANKRQDDLREAERRYNDLRDLHQREIANLRSDHGKELAAKESSRLDSIRQVDREEVSKTAAQNNLAISTLAKQTTDLATTLSNQVQSTAQAAEARRQADMAEVTKRVSAIELALSANVGKSAVADPALIELTAAVKALSMKEQVRTGFDAGKAAAIAAALAGATVVGGGATALIIKAMGS